MSALPLPSDDDRTRQRAPSPVPVRDLVDLVFPRRETLSAPPAFRRDRTLTEGSAVSQERGETWPPLLRTVILVIL